MVRVKSKKTGKEFDVPSEHWKHVLEPQGNYELCPQPSTNVLKTAEESAPSQQEVVSTDTSATLTESPTPVTPKPKRGRPKKVKAKKVDDLSSDS